jgi:hypothetical protein
MNIFLQGNVAGTGTFKRRLGGRRLTVPVNFQTTPGPHIGPSDYRHQPVPCRISFGWGAHMPVGNISSLRRMLLEQRRPSFRRA